MTLNDVWPLYCVISLNLVNTCVPTHNRLDLWRNLCTSLLYFVLRARCRRKESSRSISHLLMSFLLSKWQQWLREESQIGRYIVPDYCSSDCEVPSAKCRQCLLLYSCMRSTMRKMSTRHIAQFKACSSASSSSTQVTVVISSLSVEISTSDRTSSDIGWFVTAATLTMLGSHEWEPLNQSIRTLGFVNY